MGKKQKIILFDGVCNLCNGTVQWIIRHDKENVFRFASLQSSFGQEFLRKHKLNDADFDSFILIDGKDYYKKSTAAIKMLSSLGKPCSWLIALLWVPLPIRDWVYSVVARNRYRWFGKKESCWLPTPELKQKFL